jgi:hypothetical protein
MKDRAIDNVQNCDTYLLVNNESSYYFHSPWNSFSPFLTSAGVSGILIMIHEGLSQYLHANGAIIV